jgi:hypothetical protein
MVRNRKRAVRTMDDDGRDGRNKGTTMAWTRTRMTKGRPNTQDDPNTSPHRC